MCILVVTRQRWIVRWMKDLSLHSCSYSSVTLLASNGHKLLVMWRSYCQHVSVRGHTREVCVNTSINRWVWGLIYFQSRHYFFEIVPIWSPCKKKLATLFLVRQYRFNSIPLSLIRSTFAVISQTSEFINQVIPAVFLWIFPLCCSDVVLVSLHPRVMCETHIWRVSDI